MLQTNGTDLRLTVRVKLYADVPRLVPKGARKHLARLHVPPIGHWKPSRRYIRIAENWSFLVRIVLDSYQTSRALGTHFF